MMIMYIMQNNGHTGSNNIGNDVVANHGEDLRSP
jgi:hypothetical protein